MSRKPIIYLDTQDFSRFGDILRGKSDAATEALFRDLEDRATSGEVIFALSMPILSELLQYHPNHRETTMCKAEAAERLCGTWALAYPTRLIAYEIAHEAREQGLPVGDSGASILSSERYWFPNIGDAFGDVRERLRIAFEEKVEALQLPSRGLRRRAKKLTKKFDPAEAARTAAPEMASHFGLPPAAITASLLALLRGRITPEEASFNLFKPFANPVMFARTYFETLETDSSAIPEWMRSFGNDFEKRLSDMRTISGSLVLDAQGRALFEAEMARWAAVFSPKMVEAARSDIAEFGVDGLLFERLAASPAFAERLPCAAVASKLVPAYVRQILGLEGKAARIEHSFGGDLMHAFYLPHVDLWRGDRRFSDLVKRALPRFAERVVPTLASLPAAIDAWRPGRSVPASTVAGG